MKLYNLILIFALMCHSVLAQELPDLGDVSQSEITPQQERRLGESIVQEIRNDPSYLDDPEITDYLNDLGYRLVSNSPESRQPVEFFAVRDDTVNAFALPGGFIGVHTGLISTSQSESELASVLSHEVAHVTQRHIARMLSRQRQTALASLAALALALLASRNPDMAQAAIASAQAGVLQSQLNFTRDNEREADRVGLQILEKSGFDTRAMPAFMERLQRAHRFYETKAPSYLRTHPLTYERIADVESRVQTTTYKQVPDSLAFHLVRAKLRATQGSARDAVSYFESNLKEKKFNSEVATRYGLVTALLRQKNTEAARQQLASLKKISGTNPMLESLAGRVKIASGDTAGALEFYQRATRAYPHYRGLIYDYANALIDSRYAARALKLVEEQQRFYPNDPKLYLLQAKAYAANGKRLLQHRAQAEAYARMGNLTAAIEQLQIAVKSGDGDFYQLSGAEARMKELMLIDAENRKNKNESFGK